MDSGRLSINVLIDKNEHLAARDSLSLANWDVQLSAHSNSEVAPHPRPRPMRAVPFAFVRADLQPSRALPWCPGSSLLTELIFLNRAISAFVESCAVGPRTCKGCAKGTQAFTAVYLVVVFNTHITLS